MAKSPEKTLRRCLEERTIVRNVLRSGRTPLGYFEIEMDQVQVVLSGPEFQSPD